MNTSIPVISLPFSPSFSPSLPANPETTNKNTLPVLARPNPTKTKIPPPWPQTKQNPKRKTSLSLSLPPPSEEILRSPSPSISLSLYTYRSSIHHSNRQDDHLQGTTASSSTAKTTINRYKNPASKSDTVPLRQDLPQSNQSSRELTSPVYYSASFPETRSSPIPTLSRRSPTVLSGRPTSASTPRAPTTSSSRAPTPLLRKAVMTSAATRPADSRSSTSRSPSSSSVSLLRASLPRISSSLSSRVSLFLSISGACDWLVWRGRIVY